MCDCEIKACSSRELRSGIMYTTCDCIKRNGLQDKCPRAACQGRPCCITRPVPRCCPSSFPMRFVNMTMGVRKTQCTGGCPTTPAPACSPQPCSPAAPCGSQCSSAQCCSPCPCPSQYLKPDCRPCTWPCACKADCYDTPPKACC